MRYGKVILTYPWVYLNFMLTKIACLWPIKHTLYISANCQRKGYIARIKECVKNKNFINSSLPEMSVPVLLQWWGSLSRCWGILTCYVLANLFVLKPWRNVSWLVWCSLFWQDMKLCWNPCFSRAAPLTYLRAASPQFGLNKILFDSYYSLFIDYFHWHPSFIPDFNYLKYSLLYSWLVKTKVCQFCRSFQRRYTWLIDSLLFFNPLLHFFHSNIYYFLPFDCFRFSLLFFPWFLKVEAPVIDL